MLALRISRWGESVEDWSVGLCRRRAASGSGSAPSGGSTESELAKRTGIPQADISRIENGLLDARWSIIQRISTPLATIEQPRRRSLANGGKVGEVPAAPRSRW